MAFKKVVVPISPDQAELLASLQKELEQIQLQLNAVATTLFRGVGVKMATNVRVVPEDEKVVLVGLVEEADADADHPVPSPQTSVDTV